MSRYILIILFSLAVCAQEAPPQYNFLFIVDSSISMAEKKSAVVRTARDLLRSGFQNQIEEGDSVDLWTPDGSQVDRLPPQLWEANPGAIASRAADFIQSQKFRRGNRLDNAMSDLAALVPNTKRLLAVLITDGTEPISGINLDLEINHELPKLRQLAAKSKGPVIISFIAVDGEFVDWQAHAGTGTVSLPELPKRPKPEIVAATVPEKPAPEPVREPEPPVPQTVNYPPGTRIFPVSSSTLGLEKVEPKLEPRMIVEASVEVESKSESPAPSTEIHKSETAAPATEAEETVSIAQAKTEVNAVTAPAPVLVASPIEKSEPPQPEETTPKIGAKVEPAGQHRPIREPESSLPDREIRPLSLVSSGAAIYFLFSAGALLVLAGSIILLTRGRNNRGPSFISKSLGT